MVTDREEGEWVLTRKYSSVEELFRACDAISESVDVPTESDREGTSSKVQVVSLYCKIPSSYLIPRHTHWPIISICRAVAPLGNTAIRHPTLLGIGYRKGKPVNAE